MIMVKVNMMKKSSSMKTTNTPPGPSNGIKPVDKSGIY
jgi:hypothetical protein